MNQKYLELLRDARWQEKRLRIFERDKWTCQTCDKSKDDGISLHVHHRHYKWGRKPWEYDDSALVSLCEGCHEAATFNKKAIDDLLARIDPKYFFFIRGFMDVVDLLGSEQCLPVEFMPLNEAHARGVAAPLQIPGDAIVAAGFKDGLPRPFDLYDVYEKRMSLWSDEIKSTSMSSATSSVPDAGTDEIDL